MEWVDRRGRQAEAAVHVAVDAKAAGQQRAVLHAGARRAFVPVGHVVVAFGLSPATSPDTLGELVDHALAAGLWDANDLNAGLMLPSMETTAARWPVLSFASWARRANPSSAVNARLP